MWAITNSQGKPDLMMNAQAENRLKSTPKNGAGSLSSGQCLVWADLRGFYA
jgi:hypothetical protein